jgi:mono/diheme cytochrome c family protein
MSRPPHPDASTLPPTSSTSPLSTLEDREERVNVSQLHSVILRERDEPKEGAEPISLGLITFIAVLVFWGGFYLQRYSGNYEALVYNENASGMPLVQTNLPAAPANLYAEGKRLFASTCEKCHQANGQGLSGQYPPLAGSDWVQARGHARIIRIVLDGLSGPVQVNGVSFNNTMVPWRDVFSDQQVAAVLTFVRQQKDWGHQGDEVKPEEVAAIREKTKTRPAIGAWSAAELMALPETE